MKKRLLSCTEKHQGLTRQTSQNLQKGSTIFRQKKKLRQMKSVNKLLQSTTNFFLDQSQITIGNYKFDTTKQIGSGYSSKVYKAINIKTNGQFAVKAIQFKNFKSSNYQMLENQIQILKKLNHQNVVRFQNVFKTPTHLYIITELCQRGDLLSYITKKGKLNQKQALKIIFDIIEGEKYLFDNGILHRDIKPGNILFSKNKWKLADFGFAIFSDDQLKTKHNVGTPLYMPLQALIKNIYSPQSDIFAIGIVFYELLIGMTPWECRNQEDLVKKLQSQKFKIPEKYKLSEPIKYLLNKLCAVKKIDRMTKKQFMDLQIQYFQSEEMFLKYLKKQNPEDYKVSFEVKQKFTGAAQIYIKHQHHSEIKTKNHNKSEVKNKSARQINLVQIQKMKKSQQCQEFSQKTENSLKKIKSATSFLHVKQSSPQQNSAETKIKKQGVQRSDKVNNKILLTQLNYCRFMYYLSKNLQYVFISDINRQKIKIVLFKLAIRIIKQLSDKHKNWFNLQNWQAYTLSKHLSKMRESVTQYQIKYQKQYASVVKSCDPNIVRQVNQKFNQLLGNQNLSFSQDFFQKLIKFIAPILRQCNHNLATQVIANKKKMTEEIKLKIMGIKTLFKFYQLSELLMRQNCNYQYFQKYSSIEVVKDYSSCNVTVQQFLNMRKQMKYI